MSPIVEKNEIKKLSNSGSSDSVLAKLCEQIRYDLNITPNKFNRLMETYISLTQMPRNSSSEVALRGNLKKELLSKSMSWKVMIKHLIFLNIKKCRLTLELTHKNNDITSHSIVMNLNAYPEESDGKREISE